MKPSPLLLFNRLVIIFLSLQIVIIIDCNQLISQQGPVFFRPKNLPLISCDFETASKCGLVQTGWLMEQDSNNNFLTTNQTTAVIGFDKGQSSFKCLAFLYKNLSPSFNLTVVATKDGTVLLTRRNSNKKTWRHITLPINDDGVKIFGNNVAIDNVELFDLPCLVETVNQRRVPFVDKSRRQRLFRRQAADLGGRGGYDVVFSGTTSSSNDGDEPVRYWPRGVIPYQIGADFDAAQIAVIKRGIAIFNEATCLRLVARQKQPDYVQFISAETGCRAEVGYRLNRTEINLGDECFEFNGLKHITHEILHVIGLYHEHQRPDRDRYVTVYPDSILPGAFVNFERIADMDKRLLVTDYDYESILHYASGEYVKEPGLKSVTAKKDPSRKLGNQIGPTMTDLQKVANLYCNGVLTNKILPNFNSSGDNNVVKNSDVITLWENGVIPFEFASSLNSSHISTIFSVMAKLSAGTCLRFVPRRPGNKNYVRFALGTQCSSNLGMGGFGRQSVLLGPENGACLSYARIARFLLLTAGVPYEHRRSDRDNYVTVYLDNLSSSVSSQGFTKLTWTDARILAVPYDYQSVMHWPNDYGSKDPYFLNTIEAKGLPYMNLGNNVGPTSFDLKKLANLYCPPSTMTSSPSPTPATTKTPPSYYGRNFNQPVTLPYSFDAITRQLPSQQVRSSPKPSLQILWNNQRSKSP